MTELSLNPFFIPQAKTLGCNLRDIRGAAKNPEVHVDCTPTKLYFIVMDCFAGTIIGTNPKTGESHQLKETQHCDGKYFSLSSQNET